MSLSIDELPPVPAGKARIIFIYDKNPLLWKLTPFALRVDRRPVLWIKLIPKFSAVDVEAGRRELSNFTREAESTRPFDSYWTPRPIELDLKSGETRYFFLDVIEVDDAEGWRSRLRPEDVWDRPYRGRLREISPIEASRLLRVTRVSG